MTETLTDTELEQARIECEKAEKYKVPGQSEVLYTLFFLSVLALLSPLYLICPALGAAGSVSVAALFWMGCGH